jgi:hypothetical protein
MEGELCSFFKARRTLFFPDTLRAFLEGRGSKTQE